ncbi:hypothetical protein EDD16DRAFT_1520818 [Pisolithus croceorrhizus]|nr:hypothetical protein EDD16DRAFT_1520818 [Pisolithus croceorrhizus]KAI6117203.1 hypothetical protein EV401DRAFT_1889069 [Pisolithus croceorrhizus]KAI6161726.1 hypothetical protein EDD17DRAFT_1508830 [Pisolithus thermaeus]
MNSTGTGHLHYINGHLPPALQEDRKWTKQVLPALVTWVRSLGDPWVIPDPELMQLDGLVFSTAISAPLPLLLWPISSHQVLTTQHANAIQETCKELLDRLAFLFQDLDHMKAETMYQSQFIATPHPYSFTILCWLP